MTHPSDVPPDLMNDSDPNEARPGVPDKDWLVARADRLNAEATTSTSLDQPGTGAGYTAVEPDQPGTGRSYHEVYESGQPIPADEIAEWLKDAEGYAPRLFRADPVEYGSLARFIRAGAKIVRQLTTPAPSAGPVLGSWLLDLVHAAEMAADETACNDDHEGNDGCDGCAWAGLVEAVPVRIRNAADERASKGGAW